MHLKGSVQIAFYIATMLVLVQKFRKACFSLQPVFAFTISCPAANFGEALSVFDDEAAPHTPLITFASSYIVHFNSF